MFTVASELGKDVEDVTNQELQEALDKKSKELNAELKRGNLISEIFKHAEKINANKTTLIFVLATLTDFGLEKFHKEFMRKTLTKN